MARRVVTDEERARRAERGRQYQLIDAECDRARSAARSADLYCSPDWWLGKACREELGAALHALDDELLPAAIRIAKRMAFQVEEYVAGLPKPGGSHIPGRKEWNARMAGLKESMRCSVRRASPPAANEVVPGKTLGQYVMERFRQRAEARAGPVPAMQVPETTNPAVGAAGFGSSRRSDLECRNVTNPTSTAAAPQPPATPAPASGVIGTPFSLYGVPLLVGRAATAEQCQTAADIILAATERLQDFVSIELGSGKDCALTSIEASSFVNAARMLMLVAAGMLDARRRLDWEAARDAQSGGRSQ
jgi:hypothetical protein